LGQNYWSWADSEYSSHWKKADAAKAEFDKLVEDTLLTTPPAAPVQEHEPENEPFVSLASVQSAEERSSVERVEPVAWEQYAIKFAKGKKLTYEKPKNLPSYIGVRALVYADTTPPAAPVQEPKQMNGKQPPASWNTPAAQRQWVGLEPKDITALVEQARQVPKEVPCPDYNERLLTLADAKLREKNAA
jgi:hypothetical protein